MVRSRRVVEQLIRTFRESCVVCTGLFTLVVLALASGGAQAQNLTVVGISPARHSMTAGRTTPIIIDFDRPLLVSSVNLTNVRVFGRWSGRMPGIYSFSNGNQRLTITPPPGRSYSGGEAVFVNLSKNLTAADSTTLRAAGYAFMFQIRAARATMNYTQIDVFSNRPDPDTQTRIYGAAAPDMNGDGWLDLVTVNEVSHDLRVCLNRADGTGLFGPFLTPAHPIGVEASPNEPADFNNDGHADMATAASSSNSAWISLGQGNGFFTEPAQSVTVGFEPHGLAVLDVNGDAAPDLVSSNTSGNNLSLMINNGAGTFGPATNFEGGGNGEYSLGAGDLNNDGIFDLVVGARFTQTMIVHLGNGNGTFSAQPPQSAGGGTWMIALGDVNGDGNLDVASANSYSNNGTILLGNGTGGLAAPVATPAGSSAIASDLGDLDGDGDLDWVISSFIDGQFRVYSNNGAGGFAFHQTFLADSAASCSTLVDFDNDGDLDLVLSDEIADLIQLKKNKGPITPGDMNCDGRVNGADVAAFVQALVAPAAYSAAFPHCVITNADVDLNAAINTADIAPFAALLTAG